MREGRFKLHDVIYDQPLNKKTSWEDSKKWMDKNPFNHLLESFLAFWNVFMFREGTIQLDTWGKFHQHFTSSFYWRRSQKRKKTLVTWQFFWAFGIYVHKSCSLTCWWNWNQESISSTCLHPAFTLENGLALNFNFPNNTMPNFTSTFN